MALETLPSHEQTLSPHHGAHSCSSSSLCVTSVRTKLLQGPSGGLMVQSSPTRHPPSRKTVRSLSQQNPPSQHYNAVTSILTLHGASSKQPQHLVKAILPQDISSEMITQGSWCHQATSSRSSQHQQFPTSGQKTTSLSPSSPPASRLCLCKVINPAYTK